MRAGTSRHNYSYTLDPAGNRTVWTNNTHLTSVSYTYDNANRLTAAGNYSYGFDADGNRMSVTVGGNTTNYYFDYKEGTPRLNEAPESFKGIDNDGRRERVPVPESHEDNAEKAPPRSL